MIKEIMKMKKATAWFMNKEHGHILPYDEMLIEFMEMYDGGDPTNCAHWSEYYEYIGALD
jgi:hypothetical protein